MSQTPKPIIREVTDPTDPALRDAHALLRRTFHKTELVSRTEWQESLTERGAGLWLDTQWHILVAELEGDLIGVASGTYLGNVNIGVIGYLAVSARARGFGVGPRLRARLRTRFSRDARRIHGGPLEAIVGEVRPDNPWLRTLVRRDAVLALDFDYHQPDLHRSGQPVPLVLYYESMTRVRRRLPTTLLRQLLYTSWRRIYRISRPMSHAPFRRMLADLNGRTSIGKLTPADLPALSARLAQ
ncbi:MAG: GNAT family N-acetyltransferase [Gemmatimonadota bacterium]